MSNVYSSIDLDDMYSKIKADFAQSIDEYKKESENFWYGWLIEMEQQISVNGHIKIADKDDKKIYSSVIQCPLDGKLTIVHSFQAESYVPIPNTPFVIQPVELEITETKLVYPPMTVKNYIYKNVGEPIPGKIGANGYTEVALDPKKYSGKQLKIVFYPDVTKDDIQTLLSSYDSTLSKLGDWLASEWEKQKVKWQKFQTEAFEVTTELKKFINNMVQALIKAWDEIAGLFKLLSHPKELYEKLKVYVQNPEKIAELMEKQTDKVEKMLTFLKDEARLFLIVKAAYCWICMLTPKQLLEMASKCLASILVEVIITFVIPGGTALKMVNYTRDVAGFVPEQKA